VERLFSKGGLIQTPLRNNRFIDFAIKVSVLVLCIRTKVLELEFVLKNTLGQRISITI